MIYQKLLETFHTRTDKKNDRFGQFSSEKAKFRIQYRTARIGRKLLESKFRSRGQFRNVEETRFTCKKVRKATYGSKIRAKTQTLTLWEPHTNAKC